MRQYLVDFSTLASANKGLGSYGLGRYLHEQGTEGLTQLLDVARVVDLIVLSDSLVTSDRVPYYGDDGGVGNLAGYISLNRDADYFTERGVGATALKAADSQIEQVERLLDLQIVYDFTYEIERDLTNEDYAFVKSSARYIAELGVATPSGPDDRRQRCFNYLVARTLQYMQTSDLSDLPYVCHNFRAPIVRTVSPRLSKSSVDLYRECENGLRRWLYENFGDDRLEFSLPMFFVAALKEAKTSADILTVARQLRESKEARRIRDLLSEITDENGSLHLLRYAELRRVADEEAKKFKKKFAPYAEEAAKGSLGAEFSVTPTSATAKVSIDVMKLSKDAARWLHQYRDRRGVAVIFKTARDIYELLSLDHDIKRLWDARLTDRHKEILRNVQQCCDPPTSAVTAA